MLDRGVEAARPTRIGFESYLLVNAMRVCWDDPYGRSHECSPSSV